MVGPFYCSHIKQETTLLNFHLPVSENSNTDGRCKLCTTSRPSTSLLEQGFSLGFSLAGIDVVAAVEYHKPATKTYAYNFPKHLIYHRDINQLGHEEVERDLKQRDVSKDDIDLVIGGPPCPGFSDIGRSKNHLTYP